MKILTSTIQDNNCFGFNRTEQRRTLKGFNECFARTLSGAPDFKKRRFGMASPFT
ncbi:Codanin-1 [Caligus rogercresseyi]|uniref:Codanin-1 n=1 Tax=Caligus rogercresseyi TaxID=217165 RepID=A0A7T8HI13_CALRO|nr:Codanin-1 [Caligus rogercresseyi]